MTYYIKGGSRYNEANPTVWVALNLLGFVDSKYLDTDWKQIDHESIIDTQDPFWLMGSVTGGAKELELGLYNDYRIKFETTGITYWDGDSWEDLLAEGGAQTLNELNDVVISGTPAENELLAWDTGSSKWINQTAAEAGLALSGHTHGQLHDQNHDNTDHTTNYHTESDGTGVATVHSDITSTGSQSIITTDERNALHAAYTNEQAVQAVEDTGLVLSSTKVITSADEDLNFLFGKTQLGNAGHANYAAFGYRGTGANQYALLQRNANTFLNAITGNAIHFRINNVTKMSMDAAALTMSVPIAMGANNITLGAGQTVDGEDVSALATDLANQCTTAEAHAFVEANALTLTQNLTIDKASPILLVDASSGVSIVDIFTVSDEDSILKFREANDNYGFSWAYNGGTNKLQLFRHDNNALFDAPVLEFHRTDNNAVFVGDVTVANLICAGLVDGKDVSTLGTDAEAHAYIEANALTLEANLTMGNNNIITGTGTVDGKDVSGLCTTAEAIQAVEDTGLVLSAGKVIEFDGTPADGTYTGFVMLIDTTGCATYDAVYIDGGNSVAKAQATGIATMPAIGVVVAAGKVLTHGSIRSDASWAWAAGAVIYINETVAGELDDTIPALATELVQVMGVATEVDTIFVNPSLDWVVRK